MAKQNVIERSEANERAFDEMELEELVAMNQHGLDFECEDGHIARIIENY